MEIGRCPKSENAYQESSPLLQNNARLPVGWRSLSFAQAVEPVSDEGKRIDQRNYQPEGSLPVIDQGEKFIGGYTDDTTKSYTGPLPVVVFGDHTRRVKLVEMPFAIGAQGVKLLRPRECWSPRFFAYLLPTLPIPDRGYGRHYQYVRSLCFPCPPLDEQKRIVAEIEKQFTRLEAGVTSLKRVQSTLKRYRASVLNAACEGRLVPTEAELARRESRPYESATNLLNRILEERRCRWGNNGQYKEPPPPQTDGLPHLPDGYVWASFGQICRVQGGFAFKSTDYRSAGIALVRISNLVDGSVNLNGDTARLPADYAARFSDFTLNKGDTLIAMSGATTGKMATMESEEPALLNQRVGRFQPASETLCDRKFISVLVMQIGRKVLASAYGAAQPNISPTEVEGMAVPLPPLAEQRRIAAEVEHHLSVITKLDAVVAANLKRAAGLRQSVLRSAFAGQL